MSALLVLVGCAHAPVPAAKTPPQHAEVAQPSTDAAAAQPSMDAVPAEQSSTPGSSSEPTREAVRSFADLVVRDWMDGGRAAIYRRMSQRYREAYSLADLDRVVDQMEQMFGKLRTAEFKSASVGSATTADGVIKLWRLLYAVATDKYAKGNHFATVDVVAEPDLAILAFQIMTFTNGVPPDLR